MIELHHVKLDERLWNFSKKMWFLSVFVIYSKYLNTQKIEQYMQSGKLYAFVCILRRKQNFRLVSANFSLLSYYLRVFFIIIFLFCSFLVNQFIFCFSFQYLLLVSHSRYVTSNATSVCRSNTQVDVRTSKMSLTCQCEW